MDYIPHAFEQLGGLFITGNHRPAKGRWPAFRVKRTADPTVGHINIIKISSDRNKFRIICDICPPMSIHFKLKYYYNFYPQMRNN